MVKVIVMPSSGMRLEDQVSHLVKEKEGNDVNRGTRVSVHRLLLKQQRQRWGWGMAGLVNCLIVTNPWAPFPGKNQVWRFKSGTPELRRQSQEDQRFILVHMASPRPAWSRGLRPFSNKGKRHHSCTAVWTSSDDTMLSEPESLNWPVMKMPQKQECKKTRCWTGSLVVPTMLPVTFTMG